ncbi:MULTISPECIES: bifunctional ornithine acetyltransferase/N-acetylglutamate synthase [unclassified Paenibacillus]|uniref:bifunctional ornithine acetyltransferase/N-acetylglutamate synthase n=1 Tax=unclassified Paenibacillus TaxID=185978 RepID=UPI000956EBE6|nr:MULTISPECIES: bifunctional ornithine acetyltransferase/N-acetylglutamate synthase [unclassified Paenibacillus]ASS67213.1 bifunctional ornithine acetyltransferase/N-acetylglutamate synthase [Paenibacillus sp. RUD330]SIQ85512.1 glutamate N-acetyltransferase [Paenibacillus sp. RU4X]SIR06438.1 glutamate N-acetyltransferase [Paenibacillus sp. RU4T]
MTQETAGKPFTIVQDGSVTTPAGFRAGGLHCGLKKTSRNDLGAIVCEVSAAAAAVYTTNKVQAAPIKVTRESLAAGGRLRALLVNSGNANACTGKQGEADAYEMRSAFAAAAGIPAEQIAVASTGVIGELLKMDRVREGIGLLPQQLAGDDRSANEFCQAILTTDLVKKSICVAVEAGGRTIHVAGAAKGSGMIHPNMATMLGFVTTDANIGSEALQSLLSSATDRTFNMITVDGDTSTNDMLVAMASGLAGGEELTPLHPDWNSFSDALIHVCEVLAKAIARDGEGATKLVEVRVNGAQSDRSAAAIAKTIVGSSLVKSAVFGADANWGRIIAAAGRAGEPLDPDSVDISLGPILTLKESRPVAFDEEAALEYLKGDTVEIIVDLHIGVGAAVAWGCDLTYDYVRINAAYRT